MLLIYAGKDIQAGQLAELLTQYDYPFKIIGDESLDVTLQNLQDGAAPVIPAEGPTFILMEGMDENEIKEFNRILWDHSFDIPRKAVTTPSNSSWTLRKLLAEIEEEYAYFTAREELYELLTHPDKERIQSDPSYLKMMSQAFAIFDNEGTDIEMLRGLIEIIKADKKK